MDILSRCRICLVKDVTMHCLVNSKLQELYEKLTTMPFQSEDSRPLRVCYMCYGRLQSCHRLHLNCIKTEQLLTEMLSNNQFKSKQLVDMSTLKIVHPLVHLWYVPVNVEVTHDDETDHKMEPVDMIHVHVKEENIEDAQDDYIDDEFSEQYTAVTDFVKVEHVTEEDNDVSNYGTNMRRANYTITTERDEDNIKDTKPDISNVDVTIQKDIKPTKFSAMLLEPIEMVSKTLDLGFVEASASALENSNPVEESVKIQNAINKNPEAVAINENHIHNKCEMQTGNKDIRGGEKVNEMKVAVNTGRNPFKCDICGKCFSRKQHLEQHKRTHTGERPYKCDTCGKSFTREYHLKRHILVHTGEKSYKCDVCERSFSLKKSLKVHNRVHTGEKPYKCDMCDKSFNQQTTLIHHVYTHIGEKPYKCDACGECFMRRLELSIHKRRHTGEKPYKCDICGESFIQQQYLVKHSFRHTGEKPYKCDICEKAFNRKEILKAHLAIHTGEKLYKCAVCEASFAVKSYLTRHNRVHHRQAAGPNTCVK